MPRRETQEQTTTETQENRRTVGRKRMRVHPAAMPLGTLLRNLRVDPDAGLSPREAEKRLHRQNGGGKTSAPLFATDTRSVRGCIKQLCGEPVLWLFLALCVSALLFDRIAMGLACLGMTLAYGLLSLLSYVHTQQIDAALQAQEAPLCRVWRNRCARRISANGIVPGDIILLYEGDTIPADARLIDADPDFTVSERELSPDPRDRRELRLVKDPDATILNAKSMLHSPANMVYAGGIVIQGRARAVVVATGRKTHLGGMSGGVRPVHRSSIPESFRRAEKLLSRCNIALAALVIPMTAIGIWRLGDRYELLDIMLTALTPCLCSMTGHILIRAAFVGASLRSRAAETRDVSCSADIRNNRALDELQEIDEILLVGTAGLHDGEAHPEYLMVHGERYDCTRPDASAVAERFATYAYLYAAVLRDEESKAMRLPVSSELEPLLRERLSLCEAMYKWAELETDGVRLRVSSASAVTHTSDELPTVTVEWNDGSHVELCLCDTPDEVADCRLTPDHATLSPFDTAQLESVRHTHRQARLAGLRTCFLVSVQPEGTCLEGMIAYAPAICRKTDGVVQALRTEGIAVTAFLRNVSEENTRVLSACGITQDAPADRPPRELRRRTPAIRLRQAGVTAFEGCSTAYISDYIAARQKEGAHIAVLSGDARDRALLDMADVACTVCPAGLYRSAMDHSFPALKVGEAVTRDGTPDSSCATDSCRRCADLTVRRADASGGGIPGIRTALDTAERYHAALSSLSRFLSLSQILRLLMLLIPVCMGAALPDAPWLLLSGLFADMIALFSFSLADMRVSRDPNERRKPAPSGIRPLLLSRLHDLIGIAVAVACIWTAAGIGILTATSFGVATPGGYAGIALLSIQFALYLTDPVLMRQTPGGLFCLLLFGLVWVGALAVSLGSGLRLLWSLLLPIAGAVVFLLSRGITRLILRTVHRKPSA